MRQQNDFVNRLRKGPAGLLLGQQHLAEGSSLGDPLLALAARKLGASASNATNYNVLLSSEVDDRGAFLDWLDTKSSSLVVSESLESVAGYQWIGVWSSAIDNLWTRPFENPWREVQKIFSEDYRPSDPRNRRRLHCTFLFGSTNRTEPSQRPPLSKLEFIRRRGTAQSLARRIMESIGPTGTLAIESWSPDDWFGVDELAAVVAQAQPGQCHLFSADRQWTLDPVLKELFSSSLLTLHDESLARILGEGEREGLIDLGGSNVEGDLRRAISLDEREHSVPRDLWVAVSSVAQILDESNLVVPPPLSAEARYFEFRRFLGATQGRADWDGYARGFAFRRECETTLEQRVRALLSRRDLPTGPVILHGATGTGKSVALASVAYRLAYERQIPVVVVDQHRRSAAFDVIERFFKWSEDNGAAAGVLIWDGMLDPNDYDAAVRFFAGRGRRVIVVGSCYTLPEEVVGRRRHYYVHAPSDLVNSEPDELATFLSGFDEFLGRIAGSMSGPDTSTFLALLYRLLPPTRATVRTGVVRELERAERIIADRAAEPDSELEPQTSMAWALLDAGLLPGLDLYRTSDLEIREGPSTAIEELTLLVMVPSQFGLSIPIELALRAIGEVGYANIGALLSDIDLIRWTEDRSGNYSLSARSRLEAQLIVRSRLGLASLEADIARRVLTEVRDVDNATTGTLELDFAIELVRAMGAQGPSPERYYDSFRKLAEALRELREERGTKSPRLMLQEANLLREWSIKHRQQLDSDDAEVHACLSTAAEVLVQALDLLDARGSVGLRSRLHVELASTFAARSQGLGTDPSLAEERVRLFRQATIAALEARKEDPNSYYPADVLAWSTRDIIKSGLLSDSDRIEAGAEVFSAFDLIDPGDLPANQALRYHERKQEFATIIGRNELADEAFAALAARGSGAGVYLRARTLADPTEVNGKSPGRRRALRRALSYLADHSLLAENDPRCLNLQFDLWWQLNASQRTFADQRYCPPLDETQWLEVVRMLRMLDASATTYREIQRLFLRGLAEFHLDEISAALATFDEVRRRSDEIHGRQRIVRTYLASNSDGSPRVYRGDIAWMSDDGRRGEVFVEQLRRRIILIPSEFGDRDVERGSSLSSFHVAFNFLGPIAEPTSYLKRHAAS